MISNMRINETADSIPTPIHVALEMNVENEDGDALTLHYEKKVTADQVKEYIKNNRSAHSRIPLWVNVNEFFDVVEIREGVWQAWPTC